MSDTENPSAAQENLINSHAASETSVHWGAKDIGKAISRTERQTSHLLQRGEIRCAQKKGGRWCAGDAALRREFGTGA
jgi:hypothetical protein